MRVHTIIHFVYFGFRIYDFGTNFTEMYSSIMRVFLITILTVFTFHLAAQHSYLPSVKTLTTNDGLSSNNVHAIHKDQRGFIWIGTEYGLDRYDGQEFDFFSKDNQEHMTIEAVHNIISDGHRHLWILKNHEKYNYDYSSCELNIFDIYTSQAVDIQTYFKEELPFDPKDISLLQQVDEATIFIRIGLAQKGFFYTRTGGFQSYTVPHPIEYVRAIHKLSNKEFLIAGYVNETQISHVYKTTNDGTIIEKVKPAELEITSNNQTQLYNAIGFWSLPAYEHFNNRLNLTSLTLLTKPLYQIHYNKTEELYWLRLDNDIKVINQNREVVYQFPYETLATNIKMLPILFDGEKTWFSDRTNGIKIITLQPNHFNNIIPFDNTAGNSMRGLYLDNENQTWFSTMTTIGKQDKNGQKTIFSDSNWFTTFLEDKAGNIWRGGVNELCKHNLSSNTTQCYRSTSDFDFGFYWSIYEVNNGDLWISRDDTIIVFNPTTERFQTPIILKENIQAGFHIYAIQTSIIDSNKVWICTSQGLFLSDLKGNIIATYGKAQEEDTYFPANNFHHIYQERPDSNREEIIWLATGDGGLIRWTVDGKRLTEKEQENRPPLNYHQYTISNGLSSNSLHAVYEDDDNYLWISSDNGLMQFDKKNEQITKYFKSNGTVENEFNRVSHHQAADGTLLFGTINGWTSFHPKNYANTREKTKAPKLTFKVFQQFSNQQSSLVELTNTLLKNPTITLHPGDRFFNIHLALLDFYNGQNSTFSYRVKGVYDWQASKNPRLNFSSLPYGTHTLEIKAQNGNGKQAANRLAFTVQVMRPFYLRWWFILLVLSAIGASLFFFIKWRTEQLLIAQETAQLRNLDKLKTKFFANISHELRTPITLILAPLGQILKKEELSNKDLPSLGKIHQNGQNLLNLVNEILDLSKLEADKLELVPSPTSVHQFFQRTAAQFDSAANVKNINYQFTSTVPKDLKIELDQQKMEKIINNLLSNAVKFTPKNGEVQLNLKAMNQKLWITVKDSGRGIPHEDIPYIFDRYFQSKSNSPDSYRDEGGTGIGLALTKELVELMDGRITVQSKITNGTTFNIKMPYQLATSENNNSKLVVSDANTNDKSLLNLEGLVNLKAQESQSISTEKDTILLVEDNPSLQEFIYSILTPYYNVVIAGNGIEALKKLATDNSQPATRNPQLILSDVMMPEMDGFTLLEKVKASEEFCSIPFILLTARADIQDKLHGLRIGVDDYMTKPFEVEELLLRIRNLIANSKNRSSELPIQNDIPPKDQERLKIEQITDNPEASGQLVTGNSQPETCLPNRQARNPKPASPTKTELEFLAQAEAIVKREIKNRQFTVEDLASELYVSKRQLARKIKKTTGLPPGKYLREIKLHEAKRMLETTDVYTITEVCVAIGLDNVTHFSKSFEERFGKKVQAYLVD